MKRHLISLSLVLGLLITLTFASQAFAADKAKKPSRLSGRIHMINKDTSTITIRTSGNVQRQVVYDGNTKFTYRNAASSMDEAKEGRRVICLGSFNEKTQLVATRIDVREGK